MQDHHVGQADGGDAKMVAQAAKAFGFQQIIIRDVWKTDARAVDIGCDQQHRPAHRGQGNAVQTAQVVQMAAARIIAWRHEKPSPDMFVILLIPMICGVGKGV